MFEALWHCNNLRNDYNTALEQKKSLEFQDRLKNLANSVPPTRTHCVGGVFVGVCTFASSTNGNGGLTVLLDLLIHFEPLNKGRL